MTQLNKALGDLMRVVLNGRYDIDPIMDPPTWRLVPSIPIANTGGDLTGKKMHGGRPRIVWHRDETRRMTST